MRGLDFSCFQELEVLDLTGCGLSELPKGIDSLPKLKTLILANNPKLNIPKALLQLSEIRSLRELDLSHNRLKALPAEIYHLRSLSILKLDHNPIDAMSTTTLLNLPESIQNLSLTGCTFMEISPSIRRFSRLKEIYLDYSDYNHLVRINVYHPTVQLVVG